MWSERHVLPRALLTNLQPSNVALVEERQQGHVAVLLARKPLLVRVPSLFQCLNSLLLGEDRVVVEAKARDGLPTLADSAHKVLGVVIQPDRNGTQQ